MDVAEPWWEDRPVVLVGGGPSLRGFDLKRLAGADAWIVGVNQAMIDAPCHAGFTFDHMFLHMRQEQVAEIVARGVEVFAACRGVEVPGVIRLSIRSGSGLSTDNGTLISGGTSGYAALNLAVQKRAKKVYLFGYDFCEDGGRSHYHDSYTWGQKVDEVRYASRARKFEWASQELAGKVEVIDASPIGRLNCFRKCCIETAMMELGA